jgi:hypothetical protein
MARSNAQNTVEKEEISTFESILSEQTDGLMDEVEEEVDVIKFCEHPYYLDQPLHGAERFILRAYYGIPFDDKEKTICVRSYPIDPVGQMLTEVEYAKFLIQQERTNLLSPYDFGQAVELVLPCGRRGGKTFLASVISSYEAYKLILKGDPQKYYKLPKGEEIGIVNIAADEEQALILSKAAKNRILNSKWFVPYIESKTENEIRLRTKKDLELLKEEKKIHGRALDRHASILLEAKACTARGIRGAGVIVAILDEVAHYVDNDGNRSGDKVYSAFTPSLASFGMDGKILCISSPYIKGGLFYDLFLEAKGDKDQGVAGNQHKRMFMIPTWEMNETITFEFLDSEKKRNEETFPCEFGAEFSSTIMGFFKFPEKIDEAAVRLEETNTPDRDKVYYIAVDPAASGNGYALAMVHVEKKEKTKIDENGMEQKVVRPVIILDKWKTWNIKDPEFEGMQYIDIDIVEEYISVLTTQYKVSKIAYDQFDSTSSVNKLRKMGLNAVKTQFTRLYNMTIYGRMRTLFYENDIEIFQHKQGIAELKSLQEIRVGKKQFKVEAPRQGTISTDDLADVLANASYIAFDSEIQSGNPEIIGTNGMQTFRATGNVVHDQHAYRRRIADHKHIGNIERAVSAGFIRKKQGF